MDFIEKIFGISPDGGNGMFELMLFVVPLLLVVSLAARRRSRGHAKH